MTNKYKSEIKYYQIRDAEISQSSAEDRLKKDGVDLLTIKDLMQLSLGDKNIKLALNEYGSGLLTLIHSVEDAQNILKVSYEDAVKIFSILTLGKRLFANNQGSMVQIRCADDVYNHCRSMENLSSEQLRVLLVNSRYQLVHEEVLAIGGIEQAKIAARDIFHPAVERRVNSIVLVHNHPSGDPEPSEQDLSFTKEIVAAGEILGVSLLDHVIIGDKRYISCLDRL